MKTQGWICIYRDIRDHWIWQDAEKFKWWMDLLLSANHEDRKILVDEVLYVCKRGELICSLTNLAKKWNVSREKVRRFLDMLEKDAMIVRKSTRKMTQIIICNYASYQDDRTTNAQQTHNRRTTNAEQTHINNNYNNENNYNNDNNIDPTEQEFERFWDIYDKKVGNKQKLLQKWRKLKEDERKAIFETLPKYVAATPEKKYRLNPETYLNNKSWNNEIITDNGRSNSQQDRKHFEASAGINFKTRADFEI